MTTSPTQTTFDQGDVIVLFVPFSDQPPAGTTPSDPQAYLRNGFWGKDRPTVVVSVRRYNRADDLLVALFTSRVAKARRRGEYVLRRWLEAGLTEESAIRPRLYQAVKGDVIRRTGTIHTDDRVGMLDTLRNLLGL